MNELRMPWLEACILTPLLGALVLSRMSDRYQARRWCVYFSGLTFIFAFTVQPTADMALNHKFILVSEFLMGIFVAWMLIDIWRNKKKTWRI